MRAVRNFSKEIDFKNSKIRYPQLSFTKDSDLAWTSYGTNFGIIKAEYNIIDENFPVRFFNNGKSKMREITVNGRKTSIQGSGDYYDYTLTQQDIDDMNSNYNYKISVVMTLKDYIDDNVMKNMFSGTSVSFIDFRELNLEKVTTLDSTFSNCGSLYNIYINGINSDNITTLYRTFSGKCYGDFAPDCINPGIGIDFKNLKSVKEMFYGSTSRFNRDQEARIDFIKTNSVEIFEGLFSGCQNIASANLDGLSNMAKITNINSMFKDCRFLTAARITNLNSTIDTSTKDLFAGCLDLKKVYALSDEPCYLKDINVPIGDYEEPTPNPTPSPGTDPMPDPDPEPGPGPEDIPSDITNIRYVFVNKGNIDKFKNAWKNEFVKWKFTDNII